MSSGRHLVQLEFGPQPTEDCFNAYCCDINHEVTVVAMHESYLHLFSEKKRRGASAVPSLIVRLVIISENAPTASVVQILFSAL